MKRFSIIILFGAVLLNSCSTVVTPSTFPTPINTVLSSSTFAPESTPTPRLTSSPESPPISQRLSQLLPLALPEFNARYSADSIALSPDGIFLAVVSTNRLYGDKFVWVWNANDLTQSLVGYRIVPILADNVWSVAFSLDGNNIAFGGSGKINILDWKTGDVLDVVELSDSEAVQLAFGQNNTLIWSSFDDKVTVWNLSYNEIKYSVNGTVGLYSNSFAISPDGKVLVTAEATSLHLWDMATGQSLGFREGTDIGIGIAPATVFSSKGTFLASTGCSEFIFEGCSRGKIIVWKSDSTTPSIVTEAHPSWIRGLAFSPDEGTLASMSVDDTINLMSLADKKIAKVPSVELPGKLPPSNPFLLTDIEFLPDGKNLVVSTSDGIQLLNIGTMSWKPDLRFILSLGYPYTITSAGDNLNFRKEPSMNGEIIKKLYTGDSFGTTDGPKIVDGYVWWKVKIADDTEGWIVEQPGWYEFNP